MYARTNDELPNYVYRWLWDEKFVSHLHRSDITFTQLNPGPNKEQRPTVCLYLHVFFSRSQDLGNVLRGTSEQYIPLFFFFFQTVGVSTSFTLRKNIFNILWIFKSVLFCFSKKALLCSSIWPWNHYYSAGWPRYPSGLPALPSQILGLQAWTIISGYI